MTMAASVKSDGRCRAGSGRASGERHSVSADLIRQLIAQELYDDAMNELQWAQRTWGDSPAHPGDARATLRAARAICGAASTRIKRAYPQYLAAGGEELPAEMLQVLFPVALLGSDPKHAPAQCWIRI